MVILLIASVLWSGYVGLNHYVTYTVLKTYRLYVLQERFYADIFMLNFYAPQHYKNPPNSFGNDFDDLSEELFINKYDSSKLFVRHSVRPINDLFHTIRFRLEKEFVKVFPKQLFLELESRTVYFNEKTRTLSNAPPGWTFYVLNEQEILEQYPKDYLVLRNAWLDRIRQDPLIYLRIKMCWWMQTMMLGRSDMGGLSFDMIPPEFYPARLLFGGITNGFTMFCVMVLFCFYTFSPRRLSPQVFPFLMLAWSALLNSLPLIIFLPDDSFRYLYSFFAVSFISLAYFLAHSPLFATIVQTVQQHLEQKAQKD
ncbi:MAG: hypothetical protein FWD31_15725 [Planctomycetaceae bacterium]|nr:hypothetical protein [Planctomycetaceae bacterium]